MKAILKYLKPFTLLVILAIGLLAGQAVAELTQPNLMSDIVNVGVQQGGIEESVPKELTPRAAKFLLAFMTPENQAYFTKAYATGSLNDLKLAEIYNQTCYFIMQKFMSLHAEPGGSQANAQAGIDSLEPAALYQIAYALTLDPSLQNEIAAVAEKPADPQMASQVGKTFIKFFYKDLGLDMHKIQMQYIYKTGGRMLLIALISGLASVAVALLSARIAAGLARNLRRAVFTKVQRFSKAEIDKFSTASLITRSTNDVQQVQNMVLMGIRMMAFAPVMGVGGLIMALRKSLGLGWIIALAILFLFCVLGLVLVIVMPKFKSLQKLIDKLNLVSRENLTGLMVVRAFGNEAHEEQRFDAAAQNLAKTERFVYRSMAILMPLMMLMMNAISMLVVWFGAKAIENSTLQVGDMMAFMQYAMHIVFSFVFVAMMFVMLPRASVSAGRIREVLDTETTVLNPQQPTAYPEGPAEVSFDRVHFRYAGAEEDVLEDIHFTAKPGQTTAFIGATGAGKTTLMNLLERFYDVTQGAITINGVDIRNMNQSELRRHIGFVPQRAVLFSGTIRSNVAYGEEDAIAEDAVREAIHTAQGEDFVSELEDGLEAHVAQGGENYSGGQKQRLSIARALARKPEIYVFDDSFSALDFKTDAALRKALKEQTGHSTVFIVAQRVSTILHAEQIIVLDEGKIAGIGSHKELLQNCEIYREIAESQLSKEELA
jgi:ATP-binding cassette subfamily B protein